LVVDIETDGAVEIGALTIGALATGILGVGDPGAVELAWSQPASASVGPAISVTTTVLHIVDFTTAP